MTKINKQKVLTLHLVQWLTCLTFLMGIWTTGALAQCTNFSPFGTVTAPTAGASVTIGCQYAGEYGTVNTVAAGAYFKSTSTITTDYVTVRQGTSGGTVIAHGPQPLFWQATVAGTYYIHCNTNAACGTQSSCRDMILTSMVGCTNTAAFGTVTAPTNTTPAIIGCQYAGEYGTVNSVQAAKTYVSASTIGTDYITVHQGTYNGPIIASGLTPLTWTSAAAGTYYVHCNSNAACGIQSSCRDMSIYCTNCLTACSGAPAASNTISSANPVCSATNFNLSLSTNYSTLGNIFYQWQSSPDNVTYTNISGATAATYTASQAIATWYRCVVSCGLGGPSTNSTPLQVTMNTNFLACYCIPTTTNGCGSGDHITNVTFAGINNTSGACISGGSYSNYFAQSGSVVQLVTYTLNVTVNNGGTEYAGAWIDYDQSGTFDASEFITLTGSLSGSWNYSGTVTIPGAALTGNTGFRVRSSYNAPIAAGSACATYSYGETEDYTLNIVATTACTGTPNPGNTQSTVATACPSQNFTLSLQNAQTATNITFDWQSSPDGTTWTSTGGTSSTYITSQTSDTYYQCIVTCTNSGQSATSAPLQVTMNAFFNCYCITGLGGSCGINALSSVAIATTTLNNVTGGCTGPYNSFPASGSTTASLSPGISYTLTAGCIVGSNTQVAIWIDFNQNGIFETTEYTLINGNIPSGGTGSGTFTIPLTALPGSTGMRVRSDWQGTTPWNSGDACTNRIWGETEDYTITILVAGNCSGTPGASATTASAASVCPGGSVTLGTTPPYTDLGLTFDWQSSPDGVTYTSTGVTTQQYTVTGFSATTWYQCIITCTNGGSPVTSTPLQVTLSPFYNCYCTTNLHSFSTPCIDQIDFNTISNNTASAGCALPAYSLQSATTTVFQGNVYTFTRTSSGTGVWTGVWIDYDHSGTFDASEYTQVSTTSTGGLTNSAVFLIPVTALTGNTGMRIRQRAADMTSTDACTQGFGSGETEDYIIDIQTPVGCTGTPAASNTISSASSVCSGASFNLSLSTTYTAGGITYQWQSSPDGVTYTNISGATSQFYTATQSVVTWYQCIVTCTNSSQSITSTPVQVTMNSFASCYCASVASTTFDEEIYSVTVNGASTPAAYAGVNGCSTPAPGAGSLLSQYSNFTSLGSFTNLTQGLSIPFSIVQDECDGPTYFSNGIAIFIDYDQSGTYEMTEQVYADPITVTGPRTVTGSFTVPFTALAGQTGMRIICAEGFSGAGITGCLNYNYGETEDYIVTIVVPSGCSGTPNASNTISSSSSVCSGEAFTLSLSDPYALSGITYQWQSSLDGITYTNIIGATASTYAASQTAATYYQCVVTCTNSGLSITSAPVQVTMNPVLSCYCTAGATTNGCISGDEYVGNVTFNTINNNSTCPPTGQYSDFTSQITSVVQGSTYTASVLIPNWFGGDQAAVWIDFDQNGTFNTTTEQFLLTTGGGSGTSPLYGSITIPVSSLTGTTRMRVRGNYTGAMSPCGNTSFGEVEDYSVNITPNTCVSAPTYPVDGGNACAVGNTVTLSWPALAGATGYDVYFDYNTPPTTLVSSNQAGLTFNADITGYSNFYWMVVPQITGSTGSCSIWSFGLNPVPQPQIGGGQATETICEGAALAFTSNDLASGTITNYSWSTTATTPFTSSAQNPTVTNSATLNRAGDYTVVMTNSYLCTASATVSVIVNDAPALGGTVTNVSCWGTSNICDGAILASATGGTGAGTYLYDDGSNFNVDGDFSLNQPLGPVAVCFGPYTINVSDANGCTSSNTFNVGAISTAPPTASVVVPPINNLPQFACNGTSVSNINVPVVAGGTTKYIWDGPVNTDFNGQGTPYTNTSPNANITFGALASGASGYYIGVQAANGCGTSIRKVQWVRGTLSVPVVSGPSEVCAGGSAVYSITNAPIGGAQNYRWTGPAGTTFNGNSTPYITTSTSVTAVLPSGYTSGSICVTANASCISSAPKCVAVSTSAPAIGIMSGVFSVCPGTSQTYSVPNAGAGTYNWTLPANATGSSTSNSITVTFNSGFIGGNLAVTYTNLCGQTSELRRRTIILGSPGVPASITGNSNGVCGQTVSYSCPPQAGATFTWSASNGTVTSGQGTNSVTISFGTFTTGTVSVIASNSCGASGSRTISIKGSPNTPGFITANPAVWCNNDAGIQFSSNLAGVTGVYALNWTVTPAAAATYVTGQGTNSYTVDWNTGNATVSLTASNACGAGTRTYAATTGCREAGTPTVATGMEIEVYPNPASELLSISYNAAEAGNTVIELKDMSGRILTTTLYTTQEGSNHHSIDVSKLSKGVYMLEVNTHQGQSQTRVVVQ